MKRSFSIFFVEHRDRELGFVRSFAQSLSHDSISFILSIDFHLFLLPILFLFRRNLKYIFFPGLTRADNSLASILARAFPSSVFISLNWEQYLSSASYRYKLSEFFSLGVPLYQISWSDLFTSHLLSRGWPKSSILHCRDFNLLEYEKYTNEPLEQSLCFLPVNFAWSFVADSWLNQRIKSGYDPGNAYIYRSFMSRTRDIFLRDLVNHASANPATTFLLRPHPFVTTSDYNRVLASLSLTKPPNLIISRESSVHYWTMKCSLLISNYSTSAFYSHLLGIPTYMFTPETLPSFLEVPWHKCVPYITSFDQILSSDRSPRLSSKNQVFYDKPIFPDLPDLPQRTPPLSRTSHSSLHQDFSLFFLLFYLHLNTLVRSIYFILFKLRLRPQTTTTYDFFLPRLIH